VSRVEKCIRETPPRENIPEERKDVREKRSRGHHATANINFSRLMEESSGRYNVSRQDYAPPGPE